MRIGKLEVETYFNGWNWFDLDAYNNRRNREFFLTILKLGLIIRWWKE